MSSDVHRPLFAAGADVRATYERLAPRYDHFRELWIRWFGREAEQAMLDGLAATLMSGALVLDAGAGTGTIARRIVELRLDVQLTLLDLSSAMLDRAADLPTERVVGNVLDLPFPDERFDIVVSAWVIETVPDPLRAVRELLRVLTPEGHLFYTFCSLPDGWFSRAGSALLRRAIYHGFAGEFLPEQRTPWHDCEHSHRTRFHGGLTTEVALRKCCTVGDPILPQRQRVARTETAYGRTSCSIAHRRCREALVVRSVRSSPRRRPRPQARTLADQPADHPSRAGRPTPHREAADGGA